MFKIVGVDIGYGFVKVTDGSKGFSFPSVIGDGYIAQTYSIRREKVLPINDLKVSINGNLYFVGKAALKYSNYLYRDLSQSRAVGNELEVLYLTALSLFATDPVNNFKIVTGLPVDRMFMADELRKRIEGDNSLKVFRNNDVIEQRIIIEDIVIVPQPLGTYWAENLNNLEQVNEDMNGRVGVVDIGFKTTDLSTIQEGEYVAGKSKSLFTGLSMAYRDISTELTALYGIEKETYALDEAVIKKEIRISGKRIDISNIIAKAFKKLSLHVLAEINSFWNIADFDVILLCGGGGQSLSSFLLPHLPQGKLASNPLNSNCIGFYSWGRNIW